MLAFLRQALVNPRHVGAVAPSSPALAAAMAQEARVGPGLVVELGPGQGPVTRALLAQAGPRTTLLAVENNPLFAQALAAKLPEVEVMHADAQHLPALLRARGGPERVDVIVSSLPWRALPQTLHAPLLDAIASSLSPQGRWVQFTYGWRSPIDPDEAHRRGWSVRHARTVWANLPPARVFVYQAI